MSFILECWLFSEYIPHYCPFVYLFVLFSKTRICPLPPGAFSIMIIGLMSILTKGEAECITKRNGNREENVRETKICSSLCFKSRDKKPLLDIVNSLL